MAQISGLDSSSVEVGMHMHLIIPPAWNILLVVSEWEVNLSSLACKFVALLWKFSVTSKSSCAWFCSKWLWLCNWNNCRETKFTLDLDTNITPQLQPQTPRKHAQNHSCDDPVRIIGLLLVRSAAFSTSRPLICSVRTATSDSNSLTWDLSFAEVSSAAVALASNTFRSSILLCLYTRWEFLFCVRRRCLFVSWRESSPGIKLPVCGSPWDLENQI